MKTYPVTKDMPSFFAINVDVGEEFEILTPTVPGRIIEYPHGELIDSGIRTEDRRIVTFDVKATKAGRGVVHIPLQPLVPDGEDSGGCDSEPYIEVAIVVRAA